MAFEWMYVYIMGIDAGTISSLSYFFVFLNRLSNYCLLHIFNIFKLLLVLKCFPHCAVYFIYMAFQYNFNDFSLSKSNFIKQIVKLLAYIVVTWQHNAIKCCNICNISKSVWINQTGSRLYCTYSHYCFGSSNTFCN